jgi:hypothetical protein
VRAYQRVPELIVGGKGQSGQVPEGGVNRKKCGCISLCDTLIVNQVMDSRRHLWHVALI